MRARHRRAGLWGLAVAALLAAAACESDRPGEDAEAVSERIDRIVEEVAELRGIEPTGPVDAEVLDPEAFGRVLEEVEDERTSHVAPEEEDVGRAILAALRHVDADVDLDAAMDAAVEAGVIGGIYVPERERMYVRAPDGELDGVAEVTAAHEAQHALQDQLVGIADLVEEARTGDAFLARNAVIEGDAVVVQERWSREHQEPERREEYLLGGDPDDLAAAQEALADLPAYLREQLLFPYTAGADFVEALIDAGGFDLVDERLADPPATTAEVLRPERHLAGLDPVDVGVPGTPGEGWTEVEAMTLGAFDTRMLLRHADVELATRAIDAWQGGRLVAWQAGDGPPEHGEDLVVGAAVAFDDPAVADEACAALPQWYAEVADGEGDGEVWVGDDDVLAVACGDAEAAFAFALAPEPETALAVVGADAASPAAR